MGVTHSVQSSNVTFLACGDFDTVAARQLTGGIKENLPRQHDGLFETINEIAPQSLEHKQMDFCSC